jgi:hypothetical protein
MAVAIALAATTSRPNVPRARAARRLRALALVFAFVFLMATFYSTFLDPTTSEFDDLHDWGVDALSIALAVVVA